MQEERRRTQLVASGALPIETFSNLLTNATSENAVAHAKSLLLTMKTPLRIAVEGLMVQPQGRCTEAQVVAAAPVTHRAVRGYLRRLTGLHVLCLIDDLSPYYVAGPQMQGWLTTEPRTRPGGLARRYLSEREQRDTDKQAAWRKRVALTRKAYDQ
jgi:hypothetical protein